MDDFANRSYMVSDITETGSHVISYTLNSKMGETTTVNSPINLISNQLPVCELKGDTQCLRGVCRGQMHRPRRQGVGLCLGSQRPTDRLDLLPDQL